MFSCFAKEKEVPTPSPPAPPSPPEPEPVPIEPLRLNRIVSAADAQEMVRATFGKYVRSLSNDERVALLPVDVVRRFFDEDRTDEMQYVKERFDCDDFALVTVAHFKVWFAQRCEAKCGSALGFVSGELARPHAMVFFVDDQAQVHLVEPQSAGMDIKPFTRAMKANMCMY